ncbi:hypothetical protein KGM_208285 [Danaus plexippus plexippus]|uniref:Uncharacterized protein n=1 Tax=Danaus plexippus plexippus TaxID=278856 RepID=A0A212F303_DANPL|nr:hypothetical protein KGM_208285 [Danaus plexippus plexippus]
MRLRVFEIESALKHGSERSSTNTASVSAVHLDDPQSEGVYGSATARVPGTTPPNFPTRSSTVKAEPVSAHFNSWFPSLAEAVPELSREAGEREWQAQSRRRICW